jgi:hypothetical protein
MGDFRFIRRDIDTVYLHMIHLRAQLVYSLLILFQLVPRAELLSKIEHGQ